MRKINYLKQMRINAGLTQREVASALGYETIQFVSNNERGLSHPPVSALHKLSAMYGVSLERLKKEYLKSQVSQYKAKLKKKLGL